MRIQVREFFDEPASLPAGSHFLHGGFLGLKLEHEISRKALSISLDLLIKVPRRHSI